MPKLSIEVPHTLGQEEALERMKGFLDRVKQKYQERVSNLEGEWRENHLTFSFTTYGFTLRGDAAVEAAAVKLVLDIPFAAMMFKGQIEQGVREELEKVLA